MKRWLREFFTKRWSDNIFKNNHRRLSVCNVIMVVFYAVCDYVFPFMPADGYAFSYGFFLYLSFVHLFLAVGCYGRAEFARKLSVLAFGVVLLGIPIGTILSIYVFLPATVWKYPEETKALLNQ
jgi:hypothetical protein